MKFYEILHKHDCDLDSPICLYKVQKMYTKSQLDLNDYKKDISKILSDKSNTRVFGSAYPETAVLLSKFHKSKVYDFVRSDNQTPTDDIFKDFVF